MNATTPKASNHASLPPMASRFVDVTQIPWDKTIYEGVETKTLLVDRDSGVMTLLMKMAPGAQLPDHAHVLIEQTWVLEGSLVCGEGTCTAGNFVWRPAGSSHAAAAGPEGGLMLAMFQIANKFYAKDGRVVDFLGHDWEERWGPAMRKNSQPAVETSI